MANAKFWDRIAPKYAKQDIADPAAYQTTLDRTQKHLHKCDSLLEIGCGTGDTARWLSKHCSQTFATDISDAMLDVATKRSLEVGETKVVFDNAAADAIHESAPFDVICAFNLIHLVDDVPATLAAIHCQLSPGGKFISKTPCLGESSAVIRILVKALKVIGKAPEIVALTTDQLRMQIEAAGFTILEIEALHDKKGLPFIVAQRE